MPYLETLVTVDYTRVILKDGDPSVPGSDYINANFISVSILPTTIICVVFNTDCILY